MAVKCVYKRWNPALCEQIRKYIIDDESDVSKLPKCPTGSVAIVADGGKAYVVNASGAWVAGGTASVDISELMEREY